MAKNFIQPGDSFQIPAPSALASGAGVLIAGSGATGVFAVALQTVASGALVEVRIDGVFDLPKATGAVTLGQLIYWDDTNKRVTTVSTSNTKIGIATLAAASGDATARVRLNGTF